MHINQDQISKIKELCIENNVKSLYAIGSVTRNDFNANSDIDLVIDFDIKDPFKYAEHYYKFKSIMETMFDRKIDLLEERGIKSKYFRQEVDKTKVKIYGH